MDDSPISDQEAAERAAFREKLQSLSFAFVGGGVRGRSTFHDATIGERVREAKQNPDAEPVGTRWV
jgi:hypothetical protein